MIKTKLKYVLIPITFALLSGCASRGNSVNFSDSSDFVKAVNSDHVQTTIVREYIPVAMPGQLMPIPNTQKVNGKAVAQKTYLTKEKAVEQANKNAQRYPSQKDFFNSMMTYAYMPGAVYTIYSAPLKITDITLQVGEKIISQAAGDTLRWQLASTYSGEKDTIQQHILVKPTSPGIENTVVVTTNKRTYHLIFVSTDQNTYMVSVNWVYPSSMVQTFDSSDLPFGQEVDEVSELSLDLSDMTFNYNWKMYTGETPNWYPQQVFSSDRQTFILLPKKFWSENTELPIIEVEQANGDRQTMINWRVNKPYLIIDSVFNRAFLKLGIKSNDSMVVVEIERK
ncbi:MAG: P-type conjugative transfer protein TrbG [Francisellaceae bacterium]|jgi:P-type conjugative transfer protein TrbG